MTTAKMMGHFDPQSTQTEEVAVSPPGLEQLVERVRCRSPFYAEHYRHLATRGWQLKDLPLINPERYWEGSQGLKNWPVLTGPVEDGIVFKTGGTTGGGKLSVFSRQEWRAFVTSFGRSLSSQLKPGARVANLFFAGDLYASYRGSPSIRVQIT